MRAEGGALKVAALDLEWSPLDLEQEALMHVGAFVEEHRCRTEDEVVEVAADAVALLAEIAPLSRRVLERLPFCRVISEFGVGTDYIDLEAAAEMGMYVTNVPDYCTAEVADHTVALALALLRRLVDQRELVRRGVWNSLAAGVVPRLADATWGILGFGKIGRAVATRALGFRCRVLAYDPFVSVAVIRGAGAVRAELDRLLRESDVISLHLPRTPETVGIIGARELTLVKPTSVLINVARGHLVDEGALLSALEQGALAGAGLDVLIDEPPSCNHPLVQHPKVLITPHMGWYSTSAFVELRMKGIAAVVDVLSGRRPRYVVAEPRGVQD